ncbi:uncharacterized protein BKA78DRAFT_173871 [Phyllosticta capitalensis]|uniref:uncharacterized protein n=1 Tax=Phyllosticta capitalensis TaxID=121624 RepID=UPI00312E8934
MTESWHIPYSTLVLHCVRLSTAASGSSQARDTHSSQLSTIMGERTRRLADDAQPVDTDIQTKPCPVDHLETCRLGNDAAHQ